MKRKRRSPQKTRGGKEIKESIKKNIKCSYGTLGLTPQSIYLELTLFVLKRRRELDKLIEDAKLLERLGCFALVLENTRAFS
jgi:3-methyl-2-oxobutanoate hydroxymethyltransferase